MNSLADRLNPTIYEIEEESKFQGSSSDSQTIQEDYEEETTLPFTGEGSPFSNPTSQDSPDLTAVLVSHLMQHPESLSQPLLSGLPNQIQSQLHALLQDRSRQLNEFETHRK